MLLDSFPSSDGLSGWAHGVYTEGGWRLALLPSAGYYPRLADHSRRDNSEMNPLIGYEQVAVHG